MPRTRPSISRNHAGPPHPTSPPPVAEILVLRIREIARCRPIPRGSASTPDRERTPAVRESKRDRGGKSQASGVGFRVSSLKLWSTGVLECWSNASRDSSFHHFTTPMLHHSNLLPTYDKPSSL